MACYWHERQCRLSRNQCAVPTPRNQLVDLLLDPQSQPFKANRQYESSSYLAIMGMKSYSGTEGEQYDTGSRNIAP
jgi:hypothetical protein